MAWDSILSSNLDQYATWTFSGAVDVTGLATVNSTVTVNGQTAARKEDYFHAATPVTAGTDPQSVSITVTVSGVPGSDGGKVLVPPNTESFVFDWAGNLIADGLWTYEWDGEGRVRKIESAATLPAVDRKLLEFQYDYMGRRIAKKVTRLDTSAVVSDERFLYDGWNLLGRLVDSDPDPEMENWIIETSFTWGLDVSGSLHGAAGAGGLLGVTDHSPTGQHHFAAYDGNANVTALVQADNGEVSARYEYGPFGEPIRVTGSLAEANPIRWSSRYWDSETDLVWYPERYYSPSLGRWLSRDPIGHEGGANLYAFLSFELVHANHSTRDAMKCDLALGRLLGYERSVEQSLPASDSTFKDLARPHLRQSRLRWTRRVLSRCWVCAHDPTHYARIPFTTSPLTSVSRKSRPA